MQKKYLFSAFYAGSGIILNRNLCEFWGTNIYGTWHLFLLRLFIWSDNATCIIKNNYNYYFMYFYNIYRFFLCTLPFTCRTLNGFVQGQHSLLLLWDHIKGILSCQMAVFYRLVLETGLDIESFWYIFWLIHGSFLYEFHEIICSKMAENQKGVLFNDVLLRILPIVNTVIRRRGHYNAWKFLTSSFPVCIEMLVQLMNKMSAKILTFWIGWRKPLKFWKCNQMSQ